MKISRDEAEYLRSNKMEHYVKMTSQSHKSRSKHYFAVDNIRTQKALEDYHNGLQKVTFEKG